MITCGNYLSLQKFVKADSDGLGNPLHPSVLDSFAFAVECINGRLPEFNKDRRVAKKEARSERRLETQRLRRAAKKHEISLKLAHEPESRLAPYRNSTIHLVTGALVTYKLTGGRHYRELHQILGAMGLARNVDFVRNRIDYLRQHNPLRFERIKSQAEALQRAIRSQ